MTDKVAQEIISELHDFTDYPTSSQNNKTAKGIQKKLGTKHIRNTNHLLSNFSPKI